MTVAVAGLVFGIGVLLIASGFRPQPEPLAAAMARLHTAGHTAPDAARASWDLRLGAIALRRLRVLARAVHRARPSAPTLRWTT